MQLFLVLHCDILQRHLIRRNCINLSRDHVLLLAQGLSRNKLQGVLNINTPPSCPYYGNWAFPVPRYVSYIFVQTLCTEISGNLPCLPRAGVKKTHPNIQGHVLQLTRVTTVYILSHKETPLTGKTFAHTCYGETNS